RPLPLLAAIARRNSACLSGSKSQGSRSRRRASSPLDESSAAGHSAWGDSMGTPEVPHGASSTNASCGIRLLGWCANYRQLPVAGLKSAARSINHEDEKEEEADGCAYEERPSHQRALCPQHKSFQ